MSKQGNLAQAAKACGGTLVQVKLKADLGPNGGCGAPTFVAGTNGGLIPCGANLTRFGKTEPYYCDACEAELRPKPPPPSIESLIMELATIGSVSIKHAELDKWWVSVRPDGHAAWWYSLKETLLGSLLDCREQAKKLQFLPQHH